MNSPISPAQRDYRLLTLYQAADVTVNNSTVLVSTDFHWHGNAGEIYAVLGSLIVRSDAAADIDLRFVAATSTGYQTFQNALTSCGYDPISAESWVGTTGGVNEQLMVNALIIFTTDGDVTLKFAQHAAVVADCTIYANSALTVTRVK